MAEGMEKHVGTIALVVAIIALFGTLVPQITDLCSNKTAPAAEAAGGPGGAPGGAPAGGPGGPGGGPGMGPGGPGMMGPGGPGGRGGFGAPSPEYLKLYDERLALYEEALKTAKEPESLTLRYERDCAKLMKLRREQGGRRIMAGATEAYLKKCLMANNPQATALEKNQAALDFQQAMDRFRGDKDAFKNTLEAFKDYPKKALQDEELVMLLAAEQPPQPQQ